MMAGKDENYEFQDLENQAALSAFPVICSSPFRGDAKTSRKKYSKKSSLDEEDFVNLLQGSDPVKMEFNRLQNEVKDKDRVLQETHTEIKALRVAERAKDKAFTEVTEELERMEEKFQASEAALENKNLEIKRISEEKKAAVAAQFAAEATVRRVHAAQKDEELPSLEAILAPLDAEIKLLRLEISKLQDDKRTSERLIKSKEAALLDAEKEVEIAKAKVSVVEDLQNRNQDLMKQIEISQEEYGILDKMHRQKVAEVEKLGQTVRELEEALLSGGATANAVRDYQRQVNELIGEKKTLERTLSRAKVTENRLATVVANEWKEPGDKVMPVKQWLEERRVLMSEMQQLRDKLAMTDRTAKTEAQLKEKLQMRLKVVEEGLKSSLTSGVRSLDRRNSFSGNLRRQPLSGAQISPKPSPKSASDSKSPTPLVRSFTFSSPSTLDLIKCTESLSKSFEAEKPLPLHVDQCEPEPCGQVLYKDDLMEKQHDSVKTTSDELVSGVLYDFLQKEVISLRKLCHEKDQTLRKKDTAIEALSRKVETLTRAMEVESKKMRREKAAMEKEVASMRSGNRHEEKAKCMTSSKGLINNPHSRRYT
ncbi:microtubule-associated protein 70-2-like isoform X1 [Aristolochia californica]|uniref:microtubule-associated protein 70-2-like isoform X1 n=1 Tax=Aristolochia californica TaxID=171875 RepID=UPI0035DC7E6F